jgi:carboxylesterase
MQFQQALAAAREQQAMDAADPAVAEGNRSLLLAGPAPSPRAALLLHGFSAGPHECGDLARLLHQRGFAVWVPRLAGQAGSAEQFASTPWAAWLDSARRALDLAAALGQELALVGHSCGGLLATLLAAENPGRVCRLVLAAPAFRMVNPWARLSVLAPVRWLLPRFTWKPRDEDEARHWLHDYSTRAVAELVRAQAAAARALPGLRQPLLLLQASGDPVISCRHNQKLFRRLASIPKQLYNYPADEHNVLHHFNPMQTQALERIRIFLEAGA